MATPIWNWDCIICEDSSEEWTIRGGASSYSRDTVDVKTKERRSFQGVNSTRRGGVVIARLWIFEQRRLGRVDFVDVKKGRHCLLCLVQSNLGNWRGSKESDKCFKGFPCLLFYRNDGATCPTPLKGMVSNYSRSCYLASSCFLWDPKYFGGVISFIGTRAETSTYLAVVKFRHDLVIQQITIMFSNCSRLFQSITPRLRICETRPVPRATTTSSKRQPRNCAKASLAASKSLNAVEKTRRNLSSLGG